MLNGRKLGEPVRVASLPPRRWPRRILVTVNIVVAMSLLSAGGVYGSVKYRLGSIHSVAAAHLSPAERDCENILLIGNQTRAGLGTSIYGSPTALSGSLSDVIMLLHLDSAKGTASILSIPRRPVRTPAGREPGRALPEDRRRLNDGPKGPDNLIQTINDDLGIPINHYIELNFNVIGIRNDRQRVTSGRRRHEKTRTEIGLVPVQ